MTSSTPKNYPNQGYGGYFRSWIKSENPKPYNSWGNGSAMRVSPIGWYAGSIEEAIAEAERSSIRNSSYLLGENQKNETEAYYREIPDSITENVLKITP